MACNAVSRLRSATNAAYEQSCILRPPRHTTAVFAPRDRRHSRREARSGELHPRPPSQPNRPAPPTDTQQTPDLPPSPSFPQPLYDAPAAARARPSRRTSPSWSWPQRSGAVSARSASRGAQRGLARSAAATSRSSSPSPPRPGAGCTRGCGGGWPWRRGCGGRRSPPWWPRSPRRSPCRTS